LFQSSVLCSRLTCTMRLEPRLYLSLQPRRELLRRMFERILEYPYRNVFGSGYNTRCFVRSVSDSQSLRELDWHNLRHGAFLLSLGLTTQNSDRAEDDRTGLTCGAAELQGVLSSANGKEEYVAEHVPAGFGIMFVAGTLSGLLGIGSGAVKVLAMDQVMKLPFKSLPRPATS